MSGVKHTPERWEIAGQYVRTPFVVGIGGGLMIADVGHGVWSAEEHVANARLIAAAPDLLEALPNLTSVIAWLRNGCEVKHAITELEIYQRRIDAAITRATGDRPEKGGAA
ncbi:hypothetical protein D3C80_1417280 [compost metagenome]